MKKSILLALDGSRESMHAAQVAWQLAESTNAQVVAQTVVDTESSWALLSPGEPGLIGSGPYVAAQDSLKASLKSIAESLIMSYETRARGHKIESSSVIDEGNIVNEILARAKDHDLVIMGHRRKRNQDHAQQQPGFGSFGVTERVARSCSKPLLIVQHADNVWKSARLVVSPETFSQPTLNLFLEFTAHHQMPLQIYCVGQEERMNQLLADAKRSVAGSAHLTVLNYDPAEGDDGFDCATDVNSDTLLVITTRGKENRETCAGTSLVTFVRAMTPATVLILPVALPEPALLTQSSKARKDAR